MFSWHPPLHKQWEASLRLQSSRECSRGTPRCTSSGRPVCVCSHHENVLVAPPVAQAVGGQSASAVITRMFSWHPPLHKQWGASLRLQSSRECSRGTPRCTSSGGPVCVYREKELHIGT